MLELVRLRSPEMTLCIDIRAITFQKMKSHPPRQCCLQGHGAQLDNGNGSNAHILPAGLPWETRQLSHTCKHSPGFNELAGNSWRGSPEWQVAMFHLPLQRLLWIFFPIHAGFISREVYWEATFTSGLRVLEDLGCWEAWDSLYMWTQQAAKDSSHHRWPGGEIGMEMPSSVDSHFTLKLKGWDRLWCQSDQHWNSLL